MFNFLYTLFGYQKVLGKGKGKKKDLKIFYVVYHGNMKKKEI